MGTFYGTLNLESAFEDFSYSEWEKKAGRVAKMLSEFRIVHKDFADAAREEQAQLAEQFANCASDCTKRQFDELIAELDDWGSVWGVWVKI